MDSFLLWLLTTFDFFASGLGILLIGAVAIVMLLFWEWRILLLGVCLIQIGVVELMTKIYGLHLEWVRVQLLVLFLGAAMLFLSARQIRFALPSQRPGALFVRIMAILLLLVCWQLFDFTLALPVITPSLAQLFLWLGVCALIMLGLGDAPLSTGIALLLWFIPIQAFIQILLPEFRLFVLIGMVEILSALACSYLMLAARAPVAAPAPLPSDVVFPTTPRLALPAPPPLRPQPAPRLLPAAGKPQSFTPHPESARSETPLAPRNAP